MKEFLDGLYRLLFKFEVIPIDQNEYAVLIFAFGCAFIGVLTVLTDLAFYKIRGKSLLNLEHNARNTFIFLISWSGGALIVGYVGQMANVFQVSLLACSTVGISWPIIFTGLLEKIREADETQEATQEA